MSPRILSPLTPTHTNMPQRYKKTFKQVSPGFDGWLQSAPPPVSYTHNLIWGRSACGGAHSERSHQNSARRSNPSSPILLSPPCQVISIRTYLQILAAVNRSYNLTPFVM